MINWNISKQIYTCVGIVVSFMALLGVISLVATGLLSKAFSEYRATSQQTQLTSLLIDDLFEARLATYGYQLDATEDKASIIDTRVEDIIGGREKALALFADQPEALSTLGEVATSIAQYQEAFADVKALQEEREVEVSKLTTTGLDARQLLNTIMQTAFYDGNKDAAYYSGLVQESLLLGQLHAERFLLDNKPFDLEEAQSYLLDALDAAATLLAELKDPDRLILANDINTQISNYAKTLGKVGDIVFRRNDIRAGTLDTLGPQMQYKYKALFENAVEVQDTVGPRGAATAKLALIAIAVIGLAALLLAFFLASRIGQGISRRVIEMSDVMSTVAKGDLETPIHGTERDNELGAMARALAVFKETGLEARRLTAETEAARKQKERDDAKRAALQDREQAQKQQEMAAELERQTRMNETLKTFTSAMAEVIEQVASGAGQLNENAAQMTTIADVTQQQSASVAGAAEQATNNVSSVASAAEELSVSLKEVTQRVMDASGLAREASADAERTNEIVNGLNEAVKEISSVTGLIQDIAEQTNLLALNATIEAARAGEAGKGFAVVASEVKALASQTAKATEDIARQIERMQNVTHKAVAAIDSVGASVRRIDESASAVAATAEEQTAVTTDISTNVQQAAAGTRNVTDNFISVSERATETGSLASEVRHASEQLNEDAKSLTELMDKFVQDISRAA